MSCDQDGTGSITVGPIKYRVMTFAEQGFVVERHTHNFDHATIGVRGRVQVNLYRDGVLELSLVLGPRESANVPAEAEYEIVGVDADSEAWCVFVNHGTAEDAV